MPRIPSPCPNVDEVGGSHVGAMQDVGQSHFSIKEVEIAMAIRQALEKPHQQQQLFLQNFRCQAQFEIV